jgi:spore coat protein CotH
MRHIWIVRTLVSLCVMVACASCEANAQTVDDLFASNAVQDVFISVNDRDLAELRDRYQENVYFPADLVWRDRRLQNIGIRSRGLASRSATKPGLKLDFNHYVAGQHFVGLESLVLDNLVTDPSMIREMLAMQMFARLGQPALRESFARVYINRVYQGLYAIVEPIDDVFLQRTWHDSSGYLFERHFIWPFHGQELADTATWREVFEPRTHTRDADAILYGPIAALFHEANQPVDALWRSSVQRYLDLDQFITHVAIETCLAEADGVLGYAGMANFYLYRSAESSQHRLIVWDKDRTFSAVDTPIFQGAAENVLVSRALTFADLRMRYLDVLGDCARMLANSGWLEQATAEAAALIADAARHDPVKPYTDAQHDAAVGFVQFFARERPVFVLRAVASAKMER